MKTLERTAAEERTIQMLRALASPVRFRIVQILAAREECVCGELVEELPVAQSTVSEHLKVLKDAGIVQGTIEGVNTCYCLDPEALQLLSQALASLAERTAKTCCP